MRYKRVIAGLLASCLILNMTPTTVMAENVSQSTDTVQEHTKESDDSNQNQTLEEQDAEKNNTEDDILEENNTKVNNTNQNNVEKNETDNLTTEVDEPEDTVQENNAEIMLEAANAELTLEQLASRTDLTISGDNNSIVTILSAEALILLSHCKAEQVQALTININITGNEVDLTVPTTGPDGQQYTFVGFGSEEYPFCGMITGQKPTIKANRAIFGGLSSQASVVEGQKVNWAGDGSSPMLADTYVIADGNNDASVPITFTNGTGAIVGKVKGSGTLNIGNQITYRDTDIVTVTGNNHAGLICNILESGIIKITEQYNFPQNGYNVTATAGNAGGLIGQMNGGTQLLINGNAAIGLANVSVTATAGNAGGIVGQMDEDSQISTQQKVTLDSPTILGSGNVGGVIGYAKNVLFSENNQKITVSSPNVTATAKGTVGGFIGRYELNAKVEQKFPTCVEITEPVLQINQTSSEVGYIGGYFGVLSLTGNTTYTIGNLEQSIALHVTMKHSDNIRAYGAIIGYAVGDGVANGIIVKKIDIKSDYCGETRKDARYHGGIIGELGASGNASSAVYLETDNVNVTDTNPYAYEDNETKRRTYWCAFGGIIGLSAKGSISKISNVTLNTGNGEISKGGGIVGYAEESSVIELSGETDFSKVRYAKYWSAAQIVGGQESALIYAKGDGNGNGWTLKRASKDYASQNNDIGNYGHVIRLKAENTQTGLSTDLLQIDETTHQIRIKNPSTDTNFLDGATIYNTDDFALFSIAWNTHGAFEIGGVTTANYTNLQTQPITLEGDVDLTGTGITGISRDSQQDKMVYSGVLNGNNHTITLALGEKFGLRDGQQIAEDEDGDGKIYPYKWGEVYSHTDIGMFAQTRGDVNNLTIAGQIRMSNISDYSSVGGLGARLTGSVTLSRVIMRESVNIDAPAQKRTYAGGVYGEVSGSIITVQNESVFEANITIKKMDTNSDIYIYAGGMIGYAGGGFHKFACNGLTVGGTINVTGENYNNAYVGGLIARVNGTNLSYFEIRSLVFDGLKINAENANKICGGLFGSIWQNVGVYFMSDSDTVENVYKGTKLTVKDASINAPNASVGGLAYRSSGLWEIRKKGIDIQKFDIKGKDVGLLVCHGERGTEKVPNSNSNNEEIASLYLKTTTYWNDQDNYSYKIGNEVSIECPGVFDEFVAYTTKSVDQITTNGINGIVSIATNNQEGVAETEGTCTTYVNRTEFGKNHKTNACSRYYYDLDNCYSDSKKTKNGYIDTQQELLLWSVYQYADPALKGYFVKDNGQNAGVFQNDISSNVIGGASADAVADFDMQKYSYYPVNLDISGITVQNAKVKFYNEEIEKVEANNKSTAKSESGTTQHYTMHCGLFLSHVRDQEESVINAQNVRFQGTIGKTEWGSGAIFGGTVKGNSVNAKLYPVTMNLEEITLDGLRVYNCGNDYAPLLINQLSSYTTLNAAGIRATSEYEKYQDKKSASSLIGNVGSETGTQMNMKFSQIVLPDKTVVNGGIFTHATLLESFQYATDGIAVATYNFIKSEDWDDMNKHIHQVTYGKEISNSTEYNGLQKWYFDREGYGEEEENGGNVVYDEKKIKDFSGYLPYVCNQEIGSKDNAHEIRINQRPFGITDGCGTYGHPFKITTQKEMKAIAEYLATKNAQTDWEIRVTTDQETICPGDDSNHDMVYQFDGEKWVSENKTKTLSNDVMHLYMLGAYYDIRGSKESTTVTLGTQTFERASENIGNTLTLEDFRGFGTEEYPFRGVITCTDDQNPTTIILKGNATGNGLIPYSYGSVIKDISISYKSDNTLIATKTISYKKNDKSDYYPASFFGGIIGCVMGGDNIIDNVSVSMDTNWLTISGDKVYLNQIGGYVGSIVGGGVIFRKMDGKSGLLSRGVSGADPASTESNNLYVNPYVGRVLDGFAFSEGCKLDNTNKNYKINELNTDDSNCIVTTGDETTKVNRTNPLQTEVKDSQGLLVLSAIVNSGAASGGDITGTGTYGTNAYSGYVDVSDEAYKFGNGMYGKVRNASYEHIGESTSDATQDFMVSVSDDRKAPGLNENNQDGMMANQLNTKTNAPYLVKKYANPATFYIAGNARSTSIKMNASTTYDMKEYQTGYQGISARYVSNALYSTRDKVALSERVVPWITSIDGNESTLMMDMEVKEYSDDDFHAASVGGLFNVFRQVPDEVLENQRDSYNMLQNLTIGDDANLSRVTLNYIGSTLSGFGSNNQYNVGVGGFAGSTAGVSAGVKQVSTANVRCMNVSLHNLNVISPSSAGGLFGNTGRGAGVNSDIGLLIGKSTTTYNNYFGLNLINCTYDKLNISGKYVSGGFAGYVDSGANGLISSLKNTTDQEMIIGANSTITANTNTSYAGGIFGLVKTNFEVNNTGGESSCKNIVVEGVNVSATNQAGGYVGQFTDSSSRDKIYQLKNAIFKNGSVTTNNNIGGLIGNSESNQTNIISDCTVEYSMLNTGNNDNKQSGGLIGRLSSGAIQIANSKIISLTESGSYSGGLIGEVIGTVTVTDTEITGTESRNTSINSTNGSSAIYGRLSTNNPITIERCKISYNTITTSQWSGSAFSGDIHWQSGTNANISIYDSSVEHVGITAPFVGGIAGQVRGMLTATNIAMSGVTIKGTSPNSGLSGVLISDPSGAKNVYVAGISLQNVNLSDKNNKVADNLYGYASETAKESIAKKCYFAFADYIGSSMQTESTSSTAGTEKDSLLDTTGIAPYAVTSPKSSMQVTKDGKEQFLYGDGASWTESDGNFTVNAQTIVEEKNAPANGHFAYKNTGVDTFDFASVFSTYNTNQTTKAVTDFPVLQISGGDATTISSYLDILTNGGFSAANALNTSAKKHVTVKADVYSYQNGTFTYDVNQSSALQVTTDKNGQISFSATTDYDNDKNRFSLLTVTFTENGHNYNLLVPILVRRMLEVDFTATLTHGTHFKSSEYKNLVNHVLDSFDNTITGYLTYVYNSADKKYVDYGWQSYVDAGGNIAQIMDKHIGCNLPAGTQLSLVDCQDENKTVYYHDITAEEAASQEVLLSNFVSTSGQKFTQKSIGELFGVKVEKDSSGKFVEVDENGKPITGGKDDQTYTSPTVKCNGKFYRLAGEGETGAYKVKIDDAVLTNGTASNISENYYLVITVPSSSTNESFINGGISTSLNISVPKHINNLLRDDDGSPDSKNNTASTYQISKGYEQGLTESLETSQTIRLISTGNSSMDISVKDKITFPNGQAYLPTDQLYQKFVSNLQINRKVNGELQTSTSPFPSGTSGTVHYYVYTENAGERTYYSYVNDSWSDGTKSEQPIEAVAGGYTFVSNGDNMELILSTDGTLKNAISLQGVRDKIIGTDTAGKTEFYVEAVMQATLPTAGLDAIPESKLTNGAPNDYAKLLYTSLVSTEKDSLSYSNNRVAVNETKVSYYREEPEGVNLTYEADYIDQLGINLLDLGQNVDVDRKFANIDTTARYDLSSLKNLNDILSNSSGIKFTLQLESKNIDEEYGDAIINAADYINVQLNSPNSGTIEEENGSWSWIIPKDSYIDGNQLKDNDVFSGSILTQAIRLKVKIDNVEKAAHYYSNYKVMLYVDILGNNGEVVADMHGADNFIYTLTKIRPEFVN